MHDLDALQPVYIDWTQPQRTVECPHWLALPTCFDNPSEADWGKEMKFSRGIAGRCLSTVLAGEWHRKQATLGDGEFPGRVVMILATTREV